MSSIREIVMEDAHSKPPRLWRFSLASLMFFVACLAGYLSGFQLGHKKAMRVIDGVPLIAMTYRIADLTRGTSDTSNSNLQTSDELAELIRTEVVPVSWMNAGGNGQLQAVALKGERHLVVSTHSFVHKEIGDFLEQRREDIGQ